VASSPAQTFWNILTVYMGVYITDADTAGVVAVKSPIVDTESKDWLWRGTYSTSECGLPTTNTLTCHQNDPFDSETNCNGAHLDVHVKRKLRKEENIVLAVQSLQDNVLNVANPGVWAARINGNLRALIMLP